MQLPRFYTAITVLIFLGAISCKKNAFIEESSSFAAASEIIQTENKCEEDSTPLSQEKVVNIYPITMDAVSADIALKEVRETPIRAEDWGEEPKQIFKMGGWRVGDLLSVAKVEGKTIFKISGNGRYQSTSCEDNRWVINFRNNINQNIEVSEANNVEALINHPIKIPDGAVTVWLGFRDLPRAYWDNEGGAQIPYNGNSEGCSFVFKLERPKC